MEKKGKVAFVVLRYGLDITGGAEYHCRMLAERLVADYEVDVLTTCATDYRQGGNTRPPGEETVHGVRVLYFPVRPVDNLPLRPFVRKSKAVHRFRRLLHRVGCLCYLSGWLSLWSRLARNDVELVKRSPFYSEAMNDYIRNHKGDYRVFIAFTVDFAPFYFTGLLAGEKAIAVPTLHDFSVSYRAMHALSFTRYAYVGFNTRAEQRLGEELFGKHMSPHGILSTGIETSTPAPWEATRAKYHLPDCYLLYMGRIDRSKLGRVLPYFEAYKAKHPDSPLTLVLMGGGGILPEQERRSDIVCTGFVTDEEKAAILQHAAVLVNPSNHESLSLIVLEALAAGKPVLVNGHCRVLKDHCAASGYAADYYLNSRQFSKKLHRFLVSPESERNRKAESGRKYVAENYNWNLIMSRLKGLIERIG